MCALAISGLTFAATSHVVNPSNRFDLYLNEDELSAVTLSISHLFCTEMKMLKIAHKSLNIQLN